MTKHKVVVKSTFNKGLLESFKVLSITPQFDSSRHYQESYKDTMGVNQTYNRYIAKNLDCGLCTLWLTMRVNEPLRYDVSSKIDYKTYVKSLKAWNKSFGDVEVIDDGVFIIGEI